MKCIRCGSDQHKKICDTCLSKWSDMRSTIFNSLQKVHGKLSKDNHPIFIKETKRLEKIWKKDKDQFFKEIIALESRGSANPVA